jgi:hypothetical protein
MGDLIVAPELTKLDCLLIQALEPPGTSILGIILAASAPVWVPPIVEPIRIIEYVPGPSRYSRARLQAMHLVDIRRDIRVQRAEQRLEDIYHESRAEQDSLDRRYRRTHLVVPYYAPRDPEPLLINPAHKPRCEHFQREASIFNAKRAFSTRSIHFHRWGSC